MAITTSLGTIITFYSWKGGVGRTMALANTAVQLARKGSRVLMVDLDLEAPGLSNYFVGDEARKISELSVSLPEDSGGMLGMLGDASISSSGRVDEKAWEGKLYRIAVPPDPPSYRNPTPPSPGRLDLLPSGYGSEGYSSRLAEFSWVRFFAEHEGGGWLENLRRSWSERYDFILIDSRTGLTDIGGICTIQMPDVLVLVFTANDQSLKGGLQIVEAAQSARRDFPYERAPLAVIPILSRWEGEAEVELAEAWMRRFDEVLPPLVSSWLPREFKPRDFLEKFRVPHVARFAFGEPLPVLTHTLTDVNLPGLAYESLSRLLHARLSNAGRLIDPSYQQTVYKAGVSSEDDLAILSLITDPIALNREIGRLQRSYGPGAPELATFLSRAGSMLNHTARFAEAEPLLRRALAIDEASYGPDHPDVAIDLSNLAVLLGATNRLAEAEPLMRRALAIDEASHGPDHPDVAVDLNNLAQLLRAMNRLAEAEPLMQRALAIEAGSGRTMPGTGARKSNGNVS